MPIEGIDDTAILKTIKSVIDDGMKHQKEDYIIPEWHKEFVRERKKTAKPEDYISWAIIESQLDEKYGMK
jgi:hemolysin-activating ACP:hemolysin acyltransferase